MTLWIDPPLWPAHGRVWSHLISDTSSEELHAFATRLGIPSRGFEGDHYDLPEELYAAAVALGATPTTGGDLVRRLQDSGLRVRKRQGERGIGRALDIGFPDGGRADVDFVHSSTGPPQHSVFAATVFVRDAADNWLVVYSRRRGEFSVPGGWREPGESPVHTAVRELREETGISLPSSALRSAAYERFYPRPGVAWPSPGRFLMIFRVDLAVVRPEVTADQGEPARWVTAGGFADLSGHSWWWPMADSLLNPDRGFG